MSTANTARRNGHAAEHTTGVDAAQCPVCQSSISPLLLSQILGRQRALAAEIERAAEARFASRATTIQQEATAVANATVAEKLARADQEKKAAQQKIKSLEMTFGATLKQQLEAQAETAAREKDQAVNAVAERHIHENMKLQGKVLELQRALEKKSPNERGEEGELDLLALLKGEPEFAADEFERVGRGIAGADIVHRIFNENGIVCGTLLYEAKWRKTWATSWTRRLRQNQIAAHATHAILVVTAFPSGFEQLMYHRDDGIIVVSPNRVVSIACLLRRETIQSFVRRLSTEARETKSTKLYEIMTSDETADVWRRHEESIRGLQDSERSDAAWQQKMRDRRGDLIGGLRTMIHEELLLRIDRIIGTAATEEKVS